MGQTKRLGLIDLGSNSSRLAIYDITESGAYRPVFEMKQNVRLAHNLAKTGRIDEDGIERAVACTNLFVRTGTLYGVTDWTAVATAAVRQAKNQADVLNALHTETGVPFRVISGEDEGHYGYLGVINTLDVSDALLFDVGGASSELMLVRNRQLEHVISLPYGGLNLRELYSHESEPDAALHALEHLGRELEKITWLPEASTLPLIGLGGTARAIAKLHAANAQIDLDRMHGYIVEGSFVFEQFEQLRHLSVAKRRKVKGISKSRAEILVAGLAVVSAISGIVHPPHLIISRNGLREGIFFEHLLNNHSSPVLPSVLEHSVTNFQRVFDVNEGVARVVTEAALYLFDELAPLHALSEADRKILWVTANIESCGCYVNTEKWTKHSAYLVLSSYLYGLTYPELLDVAHILTGKGTHRVKQLLLIIRLAKLLTLQLGLEVYDIRMEIKKTGVRVLRSDGLHSAVSASADANILEEFKRSFQVDLEIQ